MHMRNCIHLFIYVNIYDDLLRSWDFIKTSSNEISGHAALLILYLQTNKPSGKLAFIIRKIFKPKAVCP
jgi:hypothetical protein